MSARKTLATRRAFLGQSSAALAAVSLRGAEAHVKPAEWMDVNVWLGRWPFRDLPAMRDAATLAVKLKERGVTEAWVGAFEGIFERNLRIVNDRLAAACKASGGMFQAAGMVNPTLPEWEADLQHCAGGLEMRMIRLVPNYHGYSLDDPRFALLLRKATSMGVSVQIVAQMEDQRTQHPAVQVAPVDLAPLPSLLEEVQDARVMVLNTHARAVSTALRDCGGLWLDIAMIEAVGGVANLLRQWPNDQVCFGSFSPLFYWESAALKLEESDLSEEMLASIKQANAAAFLKA